MSPARAHQQRVLAALASAGSLIGTAVPPPTSGPAATAYEQMLLMLAEDRRRLKDIQSVKAKIELKRELVPNYAPWIEGALAGAAANGRAVQDEVVTTIMVWRIDIGDWTGALAVAVHVLRYKLAMPERYKRGAATLVTEEIAEAALLALGKGEAFALMPLLELDDLVENEDMPDEVRAKLNKAIGLELVRQADADEPDAPQRVAGFASHCRAEALSRLRRAFDLNSAVGVKKNIESLERALKKDAGADPVTADVVAADAAVRMHELLSQIAAGPGTSPAGGTTDTGTAAG